MSENRKSLLIWSIMFAVLTVFACVLFFTTPNLSDIERTSYKTEAKTAATKKTVGKTTLQRTARTAKTEKTTKPTVTTTRKKRATTTEIVVNFPISINTATKEEFMQIPGIGETYAERIIAYREANGDFMFLEELTEISGIGEKRLEAWSPYLTVD